MLALMRVQKQPLSPQRCLVVKLDLREILHVYLRYIIDNVPRGAAVKENNDYTDNITNSAK